MIKLLAILLSKSTKAVVERLYSEGNLLVGDNTNEGENDAAHKGYQTWHRQYDKMVVDYIQANPKLTPSQFQSYLHDLYQQPWLQQRIPNVNLK